MNVPQICDRGELWLMHHENVRSDPAKSRPHSRSSHTPLDQVNPRRDVEPAVVDRSPQLGV